MYDFHTHKTGRTAFQYSPANRQKNILFSERISTEKTLLI